MRTITECCLFNRRRCRRGRCQSRSNYQEISKLHCNNIPPAMRRTESSEHIIIRNKYKMETGKGHGVSYKAIVTSCFCAHGGIQGIACPVLNQNWRTGANGDECGCFYNAQRRSSKEGWGPRTKSLTYLRLILNRSHKVWPFSLWQERDDSPQSRVVNNSISSA